MDHRHLSQIAGVVGYLYRYEGSTYPMPLQQLPNAIRPAPDIRQERRNDHLLLLWCISLSRSMRLQDSSHLRSEITVRLRCHLKMYEFVMQIQMQMLHIYNDPGQLTSWSRPFLSTSGSSRLHIRINISVYIEQMTKLHLWISPCKCLTPHDSEGCP